MSQPLSASRGGRPAVLGFLVLFPAASLLAEEVGGSDLNLEQDGGTEEPASGAKASDNGPQNRRLEDEVSETRRENQALKQRVDVLERRIADLRPGDMFASEEQPGDESTAGETLSERSASLSERYGPSRGGVYSKAFLERAGRRAYVGGYLDLEFVDRQGEVGSFVQHRFIPQLYFDVTEQLTVASEIEFEFGGTNSAAGDGEVKVEFATLDYALSELLVFRGGALLVPLGKFNLIHDSPINDLTDRPLVDQFIIPTTFTEAGLGFHGRFYPLEPLPLGAGIEVEPEFTYEAYVVNGFRGLVEDASQPTGFRSLFSEARGLRGGRASLRRDSNDAVAGVGRLACSPLLGVEVGASVHAGPYDDRGENLLVIYAFDFMLQLGRFHRFLAGLELQGEMARAEISRDTLARASGVPDDLWGYYVQANYHFMFDALIENLPAVFRPGSTFTSVVRLDQVELGSNRMERITFGWNFRPLEELVFKLDYQLNFEDWSHKTLENDAFLFSVATYF